MVTGDLGCLDHEGRLVIEGRSKDLIIRSGHNIDPQMIENALQRHPDVVLAAAVGRPDAYAGELPVCYVELRLGSNASEDELRHFAEQEISERPAWPRHVHVVPHIPVTAVGKIFKPSLRQDAVERVVRALLDEAGLSGSITASGGGGGLRGLRVEIILHDASPADRSRLQGLLDGYLMASTARCDTGAPATPLVERPSGSSPRVDHAAPKPPARGGGSRSTRPRDAPTPLIQDVRHSARSGPATIARSGGCRRSRPAVRLSRACPHGLSRQHPASNVKITKA